MTMFAQGAVRQIDTRRPDLFAFRLSGPLRDVARLESDLAAVAAKLDRFQDRFQGGRPGGAALLMDLTDLDAADWHLLLSSDALRAILSRVRTLHRYAVIGTPRHTGKVVEMLDDLTHAEAGTFTEDQIGEAWNFVGDHPYADV